MVIRSLVIAFGFGLAACGGNDAFEDADPRCAALCVIEEPPIEGAGDICSEASAEACVEQCEARIAGLETVCASCLLEDATFGVDRIIVFPDPCSGGVCTKSGREGDCTYPEGDAAAEQACERQVNPRRPIACEPYFRDVAECDGTCS